MMLITIEIGIAGKYRQVTRSRSHSNHVEVFPKNIF